ncbi:MAG: tRNA guanosine(34) transglycosylase Tgt [Candidatus Moranbacteria bacterium CG_4_9_14_3_um_filter_40_7]|nr:MAG: tRNA guanosine(34) transglycosylase Tgt [Candidatus Moranbacteria bacterium CG_4_9_14_3_um_filter_40_7]
MIQSMFSLVEKIFFLGKLVLGGKKFRQGRLKTKSGVIDTPFFMPDATRGFVKSLSRKDLEAVGIGPLVINTYHLYLQPGMEVIRKAGGAHKFMRWAKPLLSDSGGYQVFYLIHKNPQLGKITDEKVIFRSPLDGSQHELTPEKAIQIQFDLGADMLVCLDDPPPNTFIKEKIKQAVERTIAWAKRCKIEYKKQLKKRKIKEINRPLIFGVIQGGEYVDLRKYCTEKLVEIGFDGYGFGARHMDKDGNFLAEVLEKTASFIPDNALKFALGIGKPEDIVRAASYGWDMFDCVIPTREGRHGKLFVWKKNPSLILPLEKGEKKSSPFVKGGREGDFYKTININNGKYRKDFAPVDKNCACELCRNYSRSYLHHLFAAKEPLAMRLASLHNLKFYLDLMEELKTPH